MSVIYTGKLAELLQNENARGTTQASSQLGATSQYHASVTNFKNA